MTRHNRLHLPIGNSSGGKTIPMDDPRTATHDRLHLYLDTCSIADPNALNRLSGYDVFPKSERLTQPNHTKITRN